MTDYSTADPFPRQGRASKPSYRVAPFDSDTYGSKPQMSGGRRLFLFLLALYPIGLLILSAVHVFSPQRSGYLALTQVFAPYLFAPLLLLLPFALMRGAGPLRVALALCALVFGLRFFPPLHAAAPPDDPGANDIYAMNWNVGWGGQPDQMRAVLEKKPAGIVALLEAEWQGLDSDPTLTKLYPYRVGMNRGQTVNGMALLSSYPIVESGTPPPVPELWDPPRMLWARLDIGEGRTLVVVSAHPTPAEACGRRIPRCYDSTQRDKRILFIRDFVETFLQKRDRVLLLGDFNVTEREPAYLDLSKGLSDAHRGAGTGAGSTWRPATLMKYEMPLLRIDYQFAGPGLKPLNLAVDCELHGSDHCIVQGRYEVR